ncbi:MAG: hypothetical protein AAGB00_09090 [Planctomycetota bacterium]
MQPPLTAADAEWLISGAAATRLADLAAATAPLHRLAATLRREHSAERTHLLLEQVDLRRRARTKFPLAERMLFTRVGLEQATDAWVAAYKAARFGDCRRVADLCCGIGGDLAAIAGVAATAGVDSSAALLRLAEANARAAGVRKVEARAEDATSAAVAEMLEGFDAWHIDPDRRPEGRRTTRVDLHSPDTSQLDKLTRRNRNAAIKLAPGAEPPDAWLADRELEWISRGGECKQLVVWSGSLAKRPGARTATALDNAGAVKGSITASPAAAVGVATDIGQAVYEPDAAVLAAGLDGVLADQHSLHRVGAAGSYLTGPAGAGAPLLAEFRVEEVMPFRTAKLARRLRELGVGRLELKSRGAEVDLARLRHQLKAAGEASATVIVAQREGRVVAILCHRVG